MYRVALCDDRREEADRRFLRCHQSYLVNMDYIHKAEEDFFLQEGSRISVRIKDKRKLIEQYYKYFVEK